jgi:hypothetical protein
MTQGGPFLVATPRSHHAGKRQVTLSWCQIQLVIMTAMHADSLFCITMALGNALLSAR